VKKSISKVQGNPGRCDPPNEQWPENQQKRTMREEDFPTAKHVRFDASIGERTVGRMERANPDQKTGDQEKKPAPHYA